MPPAFTAQITGLRELDQKLSQLKNNQGQNIIRDGLKAGGKVFQSAIAARAPERPDLPAGDAIPPGALKQDVEVHIGRDPDGLPAAIVTPGKFTWRVAMWVEYGHRLVRGGYSRLIRTGRNAGKYRGPGSQTDTVPEHPFIRPAYEAVREEAVHTTVTTIANGIEKAAKNK
jgi:HK97 gp10 family phage protein